MRSRKIPRDQAPGLLHIMEGEQYKSFVGDLDRNIEAEEHKDTQSKHFINPNLLRKEKKLPFKRLFWFALLTSIATTALRTLLLTGERLDFCKIYEVLLYPFRPEASSNAYILLNRKTMFGGFERTS